MRMKLRDVRTGSTFDTSYRPEEKFEQAIIETVPAQYLYKMDDTAYFMNTETYDQYEIPVVNVENELLYILENSDVKIQFYGTEVIGVTVPTTVELTVTETQPSIKGATAVSYTHLILTDNEATIARPILKEIKDRLTFLNNVGLNYLTLSLSLIHIFSSSMTE